MKKRFVSMLAVCMLCTWMPQTVMDTPNLIVAEAHSGRTDGHGGHRDNKNKSGLGSYHYHCGGYPAHLHTNGVCPYDRGYTAAPAAKTAENAVGQEPEKPAIPEHIHRIFDARYYADHNSDLYEMFGYDEERLLNHFLQSGMKEGRVSCEAFDVCVYKEKNADLADIYGDDLASYYEHYMNCGYSENRTCH